MDVSTNAVFDLLAVLNGIGIALALALAATASAAVGLVVAIRVWRSWEAAAGEPGEAVRRPAGRQAYGRVRRRTA